MIFPLRERSAFFFLVGWRKPGKSAQLVSKKRDRLFLREDPLEEPFLRTAGESGWD